MDYLKIWTSFREVISPLNDAEKGRLFDAMLLYAETGEQPDLKGNERYIWPTAKQAIDRAEKKADTLRQNGNKGGRPPKEENQTKPNETKEKQTKANESNLFDKDKEKEKEIVKVIVNPAPAREDDPLTMTDDEIHASLQRDQQIEDTAKSAGLNTSEMSMIQARRYADEYGLDKLLEAIKTTALGAQKPSWKYVEGVLKNGARENEHRGDIRRDDGERKPSGKYSQFFADVS